MLVLTRRNGEKIQVGGGIEVQVLSISRHSVKLGFSAPPHVVIRRDELPPHSEPGCDYKNRSRPFNSLCLPLGSSG
jgi:carbon storage regulator CsrA